MIETLIVLKDSTSSRYESSYRLTPKFDPILKIFEKMKKVQQQQKLCKGLLTFTTFQCDQKLEFIEHF